MNPAIRQTLILVLLLIPMSGLTGCAASPRRNPLPESLADRASIPGIPLARYWADVDFLATETGPDRIQLIVEQTRNSGLIDEEHSWLVLSGGGSNGAFAAGLLCGWTERGDRPEFLRVTGVSAGALIAPFAFLGAEYDEVLRESFTTLKTRDVVRMRWLIPALFKDAITSTDPLRARIAQQLDERVVDAIADEYRRGRRLFIMTTNLDALRPVAWDIGAIAASAAPNRVQLIRDIMLASASIPVAMPPVYFEVEADGSRYDEMHADGGAAGQIFMYSAAVNAEEAQASIEHDPPTVYIIRNARIAPSYKPVQPSLRSIGGRTITSLIRTQGLGDVHQAYHICRRDGFEFRLAAIPDDFDLTSAEPFDPAYMTALFERASAEAAAGFPWAASPPGYDPASEAY